MAKQDMPLPVNMGQKRNPAYVYTYSDLMRIRSIAWLAFVVACSALALAVYIAYIDGVLQ